MSDFLSRMAARATGHMPIVQPVIVPLYGRRAAMVEQASFDNIGDVHLEQEAPALDFEMPSELGPVSQHALPPKRPILADTGPSAHAIDASLTIEAMEGGQSEDDLLQADPPKSASAVVYQTSSFLPEKISLPGELTVHWTDVSMSPIDISDAVISQESEPAQRKMRGVDASRSSQEVASHPERATAVERPRRGNEVVLRDEHTLMDDVGDIYQTNEDTYQDTASNIQNRREIIVKQVQDVEGHTGVQHTIASRRMPSIVEEMPQVEVQAPTIQVTIGRIEVRATPPAPTRAPAARTAPSVMSLDDYVNQRSKGGRS